MLEPVAVQGDCGGVSDYWLPDLNANRLGKQWDVFNSKARALLVSGPRWSAKTWATLHKIVRHMFDTPGASVAMFSKTMKNSKEGGTWLDMHRYTLPEWIRSGIGLNYTTMNNEGKPGWKVQGDTRTPYFKITNRYGGESECRLFSLDYAADIEDKIKEQRFSLIYFSELMKFNDRRVLSMTLPCLRMAHLNYSDQMWLADTNPSEEGEASWIYKVWYKERVQTYEQYVDDCKAEGRDAEPEDVFTEFQKGLQLIEMYPEDNVRLDARVLTELKMQCAYDPGLYDRDVKGKWVYGDGDKSRHFRSFFKPHIHVLGNAESPHEEQWEVIKPSLTSVELITGWDPGDVNQAAVILDETIVDGRSHFSVLDELESIKAHVSLEEFAGSFMEIIEAIEFDMGVKYNLEQAYSDASAVEKYSATSGTFPAFEIKAGSGGRIVLVGVPKPAGSVRLRVKLVKMLLSQERLHISANCKAIRRMLKDLKKGVNKINYVVPDENKHIFDALTYPLLMRCAEELVTFEERVNLGPKPQGIIVQT